MQLLLVLLLGSQCQLHSNVCGFRELLHNCLINPHIFFEARVIEDENFAKFDGRTSCDALEGQRLIDRAIYQTEFITLLFFKISATSPK